MKKFFKIFFLVLLGVIVLGTFFFLWKKSQPVVKKYEIAEVTIGNIEKRIVATGKISPRNEVLIKPQMSGIIAEIYKKAGDKVKVGDLIAKIKVIPDMVSLNSAESRVTRAQLAYDQSKKNYDRDAKLMKEKVISKEEFDKTRLQYENDKEELTAAKDNLSLVRDGITSKSSQTSNTLVRSTINGTILDIPVKVGNSVIQSNSFNDGTTIATVANMSDMLFVGKLDETEVGKLKNRHVDGYYHRRHAGSETDRDTGIYLSEGNGRERCHYVRDESSPQNPILSIRTCGLQCQRRDIAQQAVQCTDAS